MLGLLTVRSFSYTGFPYSDFSLFSVGDTKRISWMSSFLS